MDKPKNPVDKTGYIIGAIFLIVVILLAVITYDKHDPTTYQNTPYCRSAGDC